MKQLKAIELLKELQNGVIPFDEEILKAIQELEDLQSRSCEGCKHFSTGKQPDGFSWYKCEHNFECRRCFPDNFERLEKCK